MIDLERDLLASGSSFRWLHIQSILLVLRNLIVLSPLCHLIRDHVPQIAKTAFDTVEEGADGEKAPESRVRVCLQKHSRPHPAIIIRSINISSSEQGKSESDISPTTSCICRQTL